MQVQFSGRYHIRSATRVPIQAGPRGHTQSEARYSEDAAYVILYIYRPHGARADENDVGLVEVRFAPSGVGQAGSRIGEQCPPAALFRRLGARISAQMHRHLHLMRWSVIAARCRAR
jgi:hypothetical protein